MRPLSTQRFGKFIYSVAIASLENGYASFPESSEVAACHKQLFGKGPSNLDRDYALIRDSTSIQFARNKWAAAYYLFQRRDIRRFDFDATVTHGSTAACLIAAKHLWKRANPSRLDFKRRIMAIPPSPDEVDRNRDMQDLFEDRFQDRFTLLEKGLYIKVEQGGFAPGSVTRKDRVNMEETYLHLLTRDYLLSIFEAEGHDYDRALREITHEEGMWDQWEKLVRSELASLLDRLSIAS